MSYHELSIIITEPYRDTLVRRLMDAGCLGVIEKDEELIAYFPETADVKAIENDIALMRALLEKAGAQADLRVSRALIPEQDWNESWKKGFQPIDVGLRFTILPPWEEKRPDRINLVIDPAMAFGTGHHETTRSCLVLMEKYTGQSGKESFLDVGTGTGILSVAAVQLGYRRVVAVDTDLLAVDATRKNAGLNQATDIEIREGTISNLNEAYDFIAANLVSGVLVLLAPALAGHLKPGGIAVLSGILDGQCDEVAEAMSQAGLKLIERYADGKWVSLVVGS